MSCGFLSGGFLVLSMACWLGVTLSLRKKYGLEIGRVERKEDPRRT